MLRRVMGRALGRPVIVKAEPYAFTDVAEEVKRDAIDFPLTRWGRKMPVVLPTVSMIAATLPRRTVERLRDDRRVERIFLDRRVPHEAMFPHPGKAKSGVQVLKRVLGFMQLGEAGFTGRGVGVAVVDTGINVDHDVFKVKAGMVSRHGVDSGPWSLTDTRGHGTHMSSISAGGIPPDSPEYQGVAVDARLISIKVSRRGGGGSSTSRILEGMRMAMELGADVVNVSFGGRTKKDKVVDSPYFHFLDENYKGRIIQTVSAGNHGPREETITCPGVEPIQITAGNYTTRAGDMAEKSSRGPTRWDSTKPDIAMPGNRLICASYKRDHGYALSGGTSAASAFSSGVMAVLSQLWRDKLGRRLTAHEVKDMMNAYTQGVKSNNYGWGPVTSKVVSSWLSTEYGVSL